MYITMRYFLIAGLLFGASILFAQSNNSDTQAKTLLAKTIKAHGGKKYDKANYQFTFRDNLYRFKNSKKGYNYSVRKSKNGQQIFDQLINGEFSRSINGKEVDLIKKEIAGASGGLNSVIYFATLPHKLLDPAVNLKSGKDVNIKGVAYHSLHVTFDQEGGGADHDDEYIYWIRKDNHQIDYFAYNYQVGKGGVRFRAAYNPRVVAGIIFQDYINYKAEKGTPLTDLPGLYEKEELKKLSVIATEKVSKI